VVLTALLSVALPVLLVTSIPDTGRSNAWVITLGVMVWAGFHLALLCARGTAALFSFFFWLFVYIFMGLAPTSQLRADLPSTTTPGIDPSQDSRIALIVVLGLVMFEIGTLVARSSQARRPLVHRPPDAGVEPVSRTRSVILLVVGAALSIYFIRTLGIGTLFSNRANAATTRQAAWPDSAIRGIVYATAIYPTLIAAGAMSQLRGSVAQPWRRIGWFGLLFTAVLLAVVVSPLATARYNFGTVLFALTVFFGSVATAQRVRITMATTLLGFLFIFPVIDVFRSAASGGKASRGGFFGEYLSNGDYDGFWQIGNADLFWRTGDATPFRQLTGSLFFWVPRVVWNDKPLDTGAMLAQFQGYTYENLSAPMWAEAMVNAGMPGVVIAFLLLGFLLTRMDRRLAHAMSEHGPWAIVGAVFPVYMTILLRGSWLQATGAILVALACLLFVIPRRKPGAPAGARRFVPDLAERR
jgi:hypothetical protein